LRLLIDSSGPQLVCALAEDGRVLCELVRAGAEHTVPIPVDAMPPEIDSIVVGIGPGSFIGTRTAISFANGYAAAADHPVDLRGVNSLAAIAHANGLAPVLRDARRGQWYLWTPQSCVALDEAGVMANVSVNTVRRVTIEWREESEPELASQLRAGGVEVQLCPGVTPAGLLLAAQNAEAREYVEPLYLRGFT
jgi:tRNA A37 threonylcarbamoyladenosine modification protein TsaB